MSNEELVARIKAGIDTADNMLQLWQQNRLFICSIARNYQGMAELEDLEQEGYLALYDAVDGFKSEYGYKFLTYAGKWIRQRMQRYIQNNGTVRIPVHDGEKLRAYRKLVNTFRVHLGRKPTRHEIAHNMGVAYKVVIELEKAAQIAKLASLDSFLSVDDDSVTVGDMVASDENLEEDVLEKVQQEQLKVILWNMVDNLPEQQGMVLRKRFQEQKSLRAVGDDLDVTPERIRSIEATALRGLRRTRNTRVLESFLSEEKAYSMGLRDSGVGSFNRTWTSSTERAAMFLCEGEQQIKR